MTYDIYIYDNPGGYRIRAHHLMSNTLVASDWHHVTATDLHSRLTTMHKGVQAMATRGRHPYPVAVSTTRVGSRHDKIVYRWFDNSLREWQTVTLWIKEV